VCVCVKRMFKKLDDDLRHILSTRWRMEIQLKLLLSVLDVFLSFLKVLSIM
jgi:hypothetical protein